jgi:hypothetical protein
MEQTRTIDLYGFKVLTLNCLGQENLFLLKELLLLTNDDVSPSVALRRFPQGKDFLRCAELGFQGRYR